jgi:hypothetical protein
MNIPETHWDLLRDEVKAFAMLATIMEDGICPEHVTTNG